MDFSFLAAQLSAALELVQESRDYLSSCSSGTLIRLESPAETNLLHIEVAKLRAEKAALCARLKMFDLKKDEDSVRKLFLGGEEAKSTLLK